MLYDFFLIVSAGLIVGMAADLVFFALLGFERVISTIAITLISLFFALCFCYSLKAGQILSDAKNADGIKILVRWVLPFFIGGGFAAGISITLFPDILYYNMVNPAAAVHSGIIILASIALGTWLMILLIKKI